MKDKFVASKKLITFLLLALTFTANAKVYYVSNSGSDNNNGLTTSKPWKTLAKVSSFTGFIAGDEILFNRDEIFYGSLKINNSGSSGSPITIGAYGTGDNPVITGFTTITDWTNLGSNIWESTNAVSTLPYTNMVTVNGVNTAMGRYPNSSFLIWDSRVENISITSSGLTGTPNWKGAELAIFTTTYRLNRHPITAQVGPLLTYSTGTNIDFFQDPSTFFVQNFLIQNDPRTLDAANEWYYNPSTKKLRMYKTSTPANVQIATVDTLTWTNHKSYITYENLSFVGSGKNAVELGASSYITIQNCDFSFIGRDAIYGPSWGQNLPGLTVSNCTFNQINNTGIDISNWFNYATITGNTIKNVGMLTGMMSYNSTAMANGISALGPNNTISYNVIDTTGENAITCRGSNTTVNNNFVKNFCIGAGIKDGGGIYTVGNGTQTNMRILNNIVLNSSPESKGIDLDDKANGIEIAGNTSSSTQRGIYLHNTWNVNVHHNTTFGSFQAELLMVANDPSIDMSNITIKNNIFVAKTATQRTIWNNTMDKASMPTPFISDSNYFARPIDDDLTIQTYLSPDVTQRNLASWQALNKQDAHSKKSPKAITNVNDLRLEYNATTSNKTISLDGNYIDVKNVSYNGTITLKPFTSAVLIRNGAATNQSPVANAGADLTITLPTNTVTLGGSGTDADGSISTYSWTKISGPSAGTITKATSASTTVTGLVLGTYVFELEVTDNKGATGTNTIQVIVKSTSNQAPVVDAGGSQEVTTTSTTLKGTASDDGSIASYAWTKISGPAATIVSPSSITTSVTGLVAGTYQFQLKVTDNKGVSSIDVVLITVTSLLPAVNPSNTVNGLDYSYYEAASYTVLPNFSTLTPVKTGSSADFDISVANKTTQFSFNFTGYINIPADGQYTFYTTSDDGSNLYIDGILVVNNDGVHASAEASGTIGLKAGKHAISVVYFQGAGNKVLNVMYEGPGTSKQDIPLSSLYRISTGLLPAVYPANTVNGIDYSYYESTLGFITVPRFSSLIPAETGSATNFNIAYANRPSSFAFNFTGYITVPTDGQYTFYTTSDDGSNLYIDNILVVNNDGLHGAVEKSGTVGLEAGKHAISVGFFQAGGNKSLAVGYKGPGVAKQNVPASTLYRVQGSSLLASGGSNLNQIITSSPQVGLQVYPNPFANYIKININEGISGEYKLMLVDVLGKVLWTKSGISTGAFQESVNTSALQRGVYFLKVIQNSTTNSVIKLVK